MALVAGTRLGPYEITGSLGAGGMGEVYRARDTRLDRSVAIKVLPADLVSDADPSTSSGSARASARADPRARFEREARTISSLNHPHICALYDVGDDEGVPYLVMEHLEGETLEARLRKGPLPLDQALDLGAQIADALSAAHRHGIVHRDLKPANVMLTKAGAKLLDFGLAKLRPQEGVRLVRDSSATVTQERDVTAAGTLVGTLPYMAPEQVEGREADARTDLWALGCLLYEMVTGQRAFEGATTGSLVGAILAKEPAPLASRQPLTPPALERLVKRCLAKDPDQRWDSAHDVADELRWLVTAGAQAASDIRPAPGRAWPARRAWTLAAAALVIGLASGAALLVRLRPASPPPSLRVVRSLIDVRPADELNAGGVTEPVLTPSGSRTAVAWTPDGRALLFVGRRGGVQQLYVRELDRPEASPLAGTEGGMCPVVSADGKWVAFWASGAIRRVPLAGGPTTALVENVPWPPFRIAWGGNGELLYDAGTVQGSDTWGVWSAVPGQQPKLMAAPRAGELLNALPEWLPGEAAFLYTVRGQLAVWGDERVVVQRVTSGERKVVLEGATDARYVSTGHLVFLRRGVLHAVPFDAGAWEVRGEPVALVSDVAQALSALDTDDATGAGHYAVSAHGSLAYEPGGIAPFPPRRLVAVNRAGVVSTLSAPPSLYAGAVRLSPDGRRLAIAVRELTARRIWIWDVSRGVLTPLTSRGEAFTRRGPAMDRESLSFPSIAASYRW